MVDEKKVAVASFIINLFKDLDSLTYFYSEYRTLLLKYSLKVKALEDNKNIDAVLTSTDKELYAYNIKNIRFAMNKIDIKIQSLKSTIFKKNTDEIKELEKMYLSFDDSEVFEDANLRKFIIKLNSIFAQDVMGALLQNAEDYINNLYE